MKINTKDACQLVFLYLVIPNILFIVADSLFFLPRSWINIDYLVVAAAACWLPRIVTGVSISLVLMADLFLTVAPGYHFHPKTALMAINDIAHLDSLYGIYTIAFIMLSFVLLGSLLSWKTPIIHSKLCTSIIIFSLAILIGFADSLVGGRYTTDSGHRRNTYDISTSTALQLFRITQSVIDDPDVFFGSPQIVDQNIPGASAPIFDAIRDAQPLKKTIWLIMVESLGVFKNEDIDRLQWRALSNPEISTRFDIEYGVVPFHGSTVPAELRELCGVVLSSYPRRSQDVEDLQCLPKLLRDYGYQTLAIHGFTGSMFSRLAWYPAIGFDDVLFINRLRSQVPDRLCGLSFRGLCDADVARVVASELSEHQNSPQFVYWLTLNGHMPHGQVAQEDARLDCNHGTLKNQPSVVCDTVRLHDIVISSAVDVLLDWEGELPIVIIVGDHSPHFLRDNLRRMVDAELVPYVRLIPKSAE